MILVRIVYSSLFATPALAPPLPNPFGAAISHGGTAEQRSVHGIPLPVCGRGIGRRRILRHRIRAAHDAARINMQGNWRTRPNARRHVLGGRIFLSPTRRRGRDRV